MGSRTTIFVMFLFILPTLIISDTSPIQRVSAASNCDNGDFVTPEWNTTVERLAKVPNIYTPDFENERKGKRDRDRDDVEPTNFEDYDGPEEEWMTWEPDNSLRLLREDFQTTMLIGENAIGTLRVNLDHERRTTICVTIQTMNSSIDPLADGYLITTSQYD